MAGIFQSGVLRERFQVGEIRDTTLNEICLEAREKFPFYFALPYTDPCALFAWRVYVRFRCIRDLEFRRVVWEMCRRDVAFFAVTFGFIFEPRPLPRRLPFHLWTDQVTLLCWFEEIFGKRPAGVNKTRGIGMSWLTTVFLFHKWLFVVEVKIGVLTKDKDLLDGPDCNSLLGKFQYLFDNLPEWAKVTSSGSCKLSRMVKTTSFINVSTKAVIQGFVSTSAKLRQLRFTIIFADEYAYYERSDQEEWLVSAGGCTNCLLMVSTWNCLGGETKVLTNNGVKIITEVTPDDKLWDGIEWVSHKGLVFSGVKDTISAYGTWMTPDHTVLTTEGWRHAKHGINRLYVEPPRCFEARPRGQQSQPPIQNVPNLVEHDSALHESEQHSLQVLRRTGNTCALSLDDVHTLPSRHGRSTLGNDVGAGSQRQELLQEQLPVGHAIGTIPQHSHINSGENFAGCNGRVSASRGGRRYPECNTPPYVARIHGGPTDTADAETRHQAVYDLVNAGPRSRFAIVSPDGTLTIVLNSFEDAFHRIMFEEESSLLRINAFWWNNFERWQGAYKMEGGRFVPIDPQYQHTDGYQFGVPEYLAEGYIRSPWVDAELSMPGINRLKALRDIYGMSVCEQTNNFFASETRAALRESIREPEVLGLLDVTKGKVTILPTLKGDIRIWGGIPHRDRGPYISFSDLSQGVGQAYCVQSVFDRGGEQVLEYGTNIVNTVQFAHNTVLLARWLAGDNGDGWVLMDFEANGQQAKPYAAELLRLNYGNIHKSDIRSNTVRRIGEVPTYYGTSNRDKGLANFRELERAILSMDCILRSDRIAEDMRRCGKDEDGRPSFAITREGHGDYAHAAGGGWWRSRTQATLDARAEIENDNARVAIAQLSGLSFDKAANRLWSDNR